MSITIELTQDEENLLRRAAEVRGQEISAYVKTLALTTAQSERLEFFSTNSEAVWQRLSEAGHAATTKARATLRDRGVASIYRNEEGLIVEELPNGTIRPAMGKE